MRLRADRNYTLLGHLSKEVGWGYSELVSNLEAQRQVKEKEFYLEKKAKILALKKATATADLSKVAPVLEQFGY